MMRKPGAISRPVTDPNRIAQKTEEVPDHLLTLLSRLKWGSQPLNRTDNL